MGAFINPALVSTLITFTVGLIVGACLGVLIMAAMRMGDE